MEQNKEIAYQSAGTRKTITTVIMIFILVLSTAAFLAAIVEMIILSPFQNNDPFYLISYFGALFIVLASLINIFWVIIYIALVIVFLMWIHRVYKNLRAVHVQGLKHSPGWAVGWYFIPIANLFKPYVVMKEIWKSTFHADGTGSWKDKKAPSLMLIWWLTFIIGNIIAGRNSFATYDTFGDYKMDAMISLISEPLLIISGISLLILMGRITKIQDKALRQRMELRK